MPHNAGKKLIEAINKQIERTGYFSSVENISPNLAVHEMRKTFKRLRALIRFYIDFPEEFSADFSTQIKYFGQSLSKLRESFVNMQLFERIALENHMIPEKKIKAIREKLTAKNRLLIETGFLGAERYMPIQNFTSMLAKKMERFEIGQPSIHQIIRQLEISYQQAFDSNLNAGDYTNPEIVHDLRKKLKRLMFQFDFIRYVHPRFFKLKTFQLNTITEQLGEDHDFYIFMIELRDNEYYLTSTELEILENKTEYLREINRMKFVPRLKQFFNETPEEFSLKLESVFKVVAL